MRDSVISLNFANSRGRRNQIKARTFEVPGAGGFLLTESAPHLENWYIPDREIAVFRGDQDLVNQIKYYLSHPGIRNRMAAAGFERTCSDHVYEKRLQFVLDHALDARRDDMRNSGDTAFKYARDMAFNLASGPSPSETGRLIPLIRRILVRGLGRIFGNRRGLRAARRIVFELSWRLAGERTFSKSGWPARMFPEL